MSPHPIAPVETLGIGEGEECELHIAVIGIDSA
jgi:hypothetical protein